MSGWLLIATGVAHTLIGVAGGRAELAGMARDGVWRAALASQDRQQVTWFLMAGCMFLLSGLLALRFGRPLPSSFGWALGLVAVVGTALFGASGFLLVIPQAIYILIVSRGPSYRPDGPVKTRRAAPPPPNGRG